MAEKSCSGVYSFFNTKTKMRYIGSAFDVEGRRKRHVYRLRAGKHSNRSFQSSYDRWGEELFKFVVLEECGPANCAARERYWVEKFKRSLFKTAAAAPTSGTPGVRSNAEAKAKISKALKGRKKSEEHRANLWNNRQGWQHSAESKAKTSRSLREAVKNGVRLGPPEGWKHSEESKAKMSASGKGVPKSPAHRAAIAAALRGKAKSKQHCLNISKAKRGRT